MSDDTHDSSELSPEEREGYEGLPREKEPGDLLEERVVRALKARGLLGAHASENRRLPGRRWRPGWIVGAAAAALALFLSGLAAGQWMGARTATRAFLAVREHDAARAADQVQAAGSAYVRALTRFAELSRGGPEQEVTQGREAALGALVAATEVLAQLEPDDPALTALLRFLEGRRGPLADDSASTQQVYWF